MQNSKSRSDAAILAALNGPTSVKPLAVSKRVAAGMVGVSVRSIENYLAAKILVRRKLGKRTVVLVSSLEKFLRSDQPSARPSPRDNSARPEVN